MPNVEFQISDDEISEHSTFDIRQSALGMASTAGIAPATSTFARWRSNLTELRGQLALGHLASVIGLAPIRPDLKGRLRELLCIHGLLA